MARVRMIRWLAVLAPSWFACNDSTGPDWSGISADGKLIGGEQVVCSIAPDGDLYCWGVNSSLWEYGADPMEVPGGASPSKPSLPRFARLASGVAQHMCGITEAGDAVCWGRGLFGQLGGGSSGDPGNPPVTVLGGITWTNLSVSRLTTCGVSTSGAGYCWGNNQHGEVGSSAVALGTWAHSPVAIEGGHTFASIAAGWLHACGITTAGDALCWGINAAGQLGIGAADTVTYRSPVAVSGGLKFRQLSLGSRYTCGISTDSTAYCWGENSTGQLGDSTGNQRHVPTAVAGGLKFTYIAAGSGFGSGMYSPEPIAQGDVGHTCGIAADRSVYCWGWNHSGELGDGTYAVRNSPRPTTKPIRASTVVSGGAYSCAMQDDRVWCWGSNIHGQLGVGPTPPISSNPLSVVSPFRWP